MDNNLYTVRKFFFCGIEDMAGVKRIFLMSGVKHRAVKTFVDQIRKLSKGFIRSGNDVRVGRLNLTRGNADTYHAGHGMYTKSQTNC